jgi:hypothetical protein
LFDVHSPRPFTSLAFLSTVGRMVARGQSFTGRTVSLRLAAFIGDSGPWHSSANEARSSALAFRGASILCCSPDRCPRTQASEQRHAEAAEDRGAPCGALQRYRHWPHRRMLRRSPCERRVCLALSLQCGGGKQLLKKRGRVRYIIPCPMNWFPPSGREELSTWQRCRGS